MVEPVPITVAQFESDEDFRDSSSEERKAKRARTRGNYLPPAFIPERWIVSRPFFFDRGGLGSGERYVVRGGFLFDGASVPPVLSALAPRTHSLYLGAAALHDFLYAERHQDVSREIADDAFREAMILIGLNWLWAGMMWRAVRAAGWSVWYRRKPDHWVGRLLALPWLLRWIVILTGVPVLGLAGILVDLVSLRAYAKAAQEIVEKSEATRPAGP